MKNILFLIIFPFTLLAQTHTQIIDSLVNIKVNKELTSLIEANEDTIEDVYLIAEVMPLFESCNDIECTQKKISRFISKNLKYPKKAKSINIRGRVYVSVVIDKSGYPTKVKILRGVEESLDEEAIRVVSSLPRFTPAMHRGENVNVAFNLSVNFKMF